MKSSAQEFVQEQERQPRENIYVDRMKFDPKVFNRVFDDNKMADVNDDGYADIMTSGPRSERDVEVENVFNGKFNREVFQSEFEERKHADQSADIVVYEEPKPLVSSGLNYYELGVDRVGDYGKPDRLNTEFSDYKLAHGRGSKLINPADVQHTVHRSVEDLKVARKQIKHDLSPEEEHLLRTRRQREEFGGGCSTVASERAGCPGFTALRANEQGVHSGLTAPPDQTPDVLSVETVPAQQFERLRKRQLVSEGGDQQQALLAEVRADCLAYECVSLLARHRRSRSLAECVAESRDRPIGPAHRQSSHGCVGREDRQRCRYPSQQCNSLPIVHVTLGDVRQSQRSNDVTFCVHLGCVMDGAASYRVTAVFMDHHRKKILLDCVQTHAVVKGQSVEQDRCCHFVNVLRALLPVMVLYGCGLICEGCIGEHEPQAPVVTIAASCDRFGERRVDVETASQHVKAPAGLDNIVSTEDGQMYL